MLNRTTSALSSGRVIPEARRLARELLAASLRRWPRCVEGFSDHPGPHGRVLSQEFLAPESYLGLDEIPSETSAGERRLLLNTLATLWDGAGHVVEIGPFLGGTTRAIAMGMLANPRLWPGGRLYTYDLFDRYFEPSRLRALLRPLQERGLIDRALVEESGRTGEFFAVFEQLHKRGPYSKLIVGAAQGLPATPGQEAAAEPGSLVALPGDVGLVFVDGCKSWYSTKALMRQLATRARPGARILFQDYGWYTCFWIPALHAALREWLTLESYFDSTYAFRITTTLPAAALDELFPDTPAQWSRRRFDDLFRTLWQEAEARRDGRMKVFYRLQHAAALATIGDRAAARASIDRLAMAPDAAPYLDLVRQARHCPTYYSDDAGRQHPVLL